MAAEAAQQEDIRKWQGQWVFDERGETIGKVGFVLVDDQSKAEWIIVSTGPFLHIDKLVPLFDMEQRTDGLVLPYSVDMVKKAPQVSFDSMSDDQEKKLYDYWCVSKTAAMPRTCTKLQ